MSRQQRNESMNMSVRIHSRKKIYARITAHQSRETHFEEATVSRRPWALTRWPGVRGLRGELDEGREETQGEQEGGGLSPLHAGWNRYLPLLPAQPAAPTASTAPTIPTASATLRCSPSRSTRRQADRWGSQGNKSIVPCRTVSANTATANSVLALNGTPAAPPPSRTSPARFRSCLFVTSHKNVQYNCTFDVVWWERLINYTNNLTHYFVICIRIFFRGMQD